MRGFSKLISSYREIMRLLNIHTLELQEFDEGDVPAYACLSHRWSKEEVSYQQWQSRNEDGNVRQKSGFKKVSVACDVLKSSKLNFLWADTCCIDKTSSSELSEAINSMWRWYSECSICIAYLADIEVAACQNSRFGDVEAVGLESSDWFNRAWTLQELLAPSSVYFFDANWRSFGTKEQLAAQLSRITNIQRQAVVRFTHEHWSIAQRMSWASSRRATRREDYAYSLLGLFEIHMPLLYGEGRRAFIRFQHEIMRCSTDLSLLAWHDAEPDVWKDDLIFAPSPNSFAGCAQYHRLDGIGADSRFQMFAKLSSNVNIGNRGVDSDVILMPRELGSFLVPVACVKLGDSTSSGSILELVCRKAEREMGTNILICRPGLTIASTFVNYFFSTAFSHKALLPLRQPSYHKPFFNGLGVIEKGGAKILPFHNWGEITRVGELTVLPFNPSGGHGQIATFLLPFHKHNSKHRYKQEPGCLRVKVGFDRFHDILCILDIRDSYELSRQESDTNANTTQEFNSIGFSTFRQNCTDRGSYASHCLRLYEGVLPNCFAYALKSKSSTSSGFSCGDDSQTMFRLEFELGTTRGNLADPFTKNCWEARIHRGQTFDRQACEDYLKQFISPV